MNLSWLLLIKFELKLNQSIVLELVYEKSFKSNSTWLKVWPQFNFKMAVFHLLQFGQWSRSPLNLNNSTANNWIWLGQKATDSPLNELFQVFWVECCTTNSWCRNLNEKCLDLLARDLPVATRITGPNDLQSRYPVHTPRYPCWWCSYGRDERD